LYGLQAITAQNGWAMALVGAIIVFSGLFVLTLAISQLHKILTLFDKKGVSPGDQPSVTEAPAVVKETSLDVLTDIATLAEAFAPLAAALGETFQLVDLYTLALRDDLPHPHLSIKTLREAEFLLSQGEGLFAWHDSRAA